MLPKVDAIFIHALKFQKAAHLLNRNLEQDSFALIVPYITNISFSIELYFKALLSSEGKDGDETKTHNLKKLFSILSETNQSRIKTLFIQFMATSKCPTSNDDNSLNAVLEDISNAFVKSRYSYESNLGGLRCLNEVLDSVKQTLLERNKILERYIKSEINM